MYNATGGTTSASVANVEISLKAASITAKTMHDAIASLSGLGDCMCAPAHSSDGTHTQYMNVAQIFFV
jgi:hypothetical protein